MIPPQRFEDWSDYVPSALVNQNLWPLRMARKRGNPDLFGAIHLDPRPSQN